MSNLVEIRGLNIRFTGERTVYAVDDLSLSLGEGEVLGLLGESGSGKSVTLRALMRLLPKKRTRISGSVEVLGRDVLALDDEQQGTLRQIVRSPIHPYAQGLLASTVHGAKRGQRLETIPGTPPSLDQAPVNCSFPPRCGFAQARCVEHLPPNVQLAPDRIARCILAEREVVAAP
jgi:oligopeptide/dipeptide ABC transporter ATP-binding protein